ncbi:MAG: hypothetical protein ACOCUJ_02345 [Thiohalospira sp.]|uniref:hypothetical protein n=1 Tax=Thiohalorhabdus sp. TaxID=3094134 RepID=UPI00397FEC13
MSDDLASVAERFERSDEALRDWERRLNAGEEVDVWDTANAGIEIIKDLIKAYLEVLDRDWEGTEDDLLALWKVAVKKNPSLNTIRDNCRELIYYYNCVDMDRRDALPENAHKQAVRTARHVYLYLRTRAEEAGALEKHQGLGAG